MNIRLVIGVVLLIMTFTNKLNAQCAMCKAVVEANLKEGGSAGAGLNDGILYLMAMPYITVALFGVFYLVQQKRCKSSEY